ncbi:hypothetical protein Clacol_008835 [Clathrus columnatus]|uniref:Uncharacterized protein n=1 Tax=Clathrus columnatus TaxID=1419009 RepID=A0AAV5AP03_9AGAM|nr:hypothetical protein Clacol_008835 [Clathrus columnatus]
MSRIAIYKPPRSSPLSGPAIVSNDDGDGGDDNADASKEYTASNNLTLTSATTSLSIAPPYPTPPRTPSPNDDSSEFETCTLSQREDGFSSKSHSSSHVPPLTSFLVHQLSVRPQEGLSPRTSPNTYVRTPFSAPPTMREFHPTYDTDAIIARVDRRPCKASPPSPPSHARGTFSAPGVIRPTLFTTIPEKKPIGVINSQLDTNNGTHPPSSSGSSNPDSTWFTVSNVSPPPFSRTHLRGIVMPVKANKPEKSTKRPTTAPMSRSSFPPATLDKLPAEEVVKMSQPMELSEEVRRKRRQSYSANANADTYHSWSTGERERNFSVLNGINRDNNEVVNLAPGLDSTVKRRKWKQFLEKVGNIIRN